MADLAALAIARSFGEKGLSSLRRGVLVKRYLLFYVKNMDLPSPESQPESFIEEIKYHRKEIGHDNPG